MVAAQKRALEPAQIAGLHMSLSAEKMLLLWMNLD